LNFQITGCELNILSNLLYQNIGQNRHGVPLFNDATDRLKYGKYFVLGGFEDDHINLLMYLI
jgi:hypothetical protein